MARCRERHTEDCRRRRLERTAAYRLLAENLEAFLDRAERVAGSGQPTFDVRELRRHRRGSAGARSPWRARHEEILEEAVRVSGLKTYSATIDLALRELVRRASARRILELRGSGAWHGDLPEMRRDAPTGKKRR